MRCYRKLPLISCKDHITNEEVRAKIQQAIGPHEDLLTIVKRTQTAVVWSCLPFIRSGQNHLARHGERGKKTRQIEEEVGRQHQGMDRPGVQQVPEGCGNREKWRKLVAKSSIMPQRPSRLRDSWWWWWLASRLTWREIPRINQSKRLILIGSLFTKMTRYVWLGMSSRDNYRKRGTWCLTRWRDTHCWVYPAKRHRERDIWYLTRWWDTHGWIYQTGRDIGRDVFDV